MKTVKTGYLTMMNELAYTHSILALINGILGYTTAYKVVNHDDLDNYHITFNESNRIDGGYNDEQTCNYTTSAVKLIERFTCEYSDHDDKIIRKLFDTAFAYCRDLTLFMSEAKEQYNKRERPLCELKLEPFKIRHTLIYDGVTIDVDINKCDADYNDYVKSCMFNDIDSWLKTQRTLNAIMDRYFNKFVTIRNEIRAEWNYDCSNLE
ncbi:hypothetical protein HNP86_001830 [Methanococcus maripaludis]|uniref:Uncharacterized protein n=1 Tax=Methanococcus maripaludis TaxID=39152 RepID=A0A7J9NWH9_METMI|nr:hypothetical protein [Methanococcus maripaludis]MBA2851671.1 hypothetical protein [Methanococcus maripaludis]